MDVGSTERSRLELSADLIDNHFYRGHQRVPSITRKDIWEIRKDQYQANPPEDRLLCPHYHLVWTKDWQGCHQIRFRFLPWNFVLTWTQDTGWAAFFLSAGNWIRSSIPDFAKTGAPLEILFETSEIAIWSLKSSKFSGFKFKSDQWTTEHEEASKYIEAFIPHSVKLAHFKPNYVIAFWPMPLMATGVLFSLEPPRPAGPTDARAGAWASSCCQWVSPSYDGAWSQKNLPHYLSNRPPASFSALLEQIQILLPSSQRGLRV